MFKKIVCALSIITVLALTGCGKNNDTQNNQVENNQVENSQVEETTPVDYAAQLEEIHTAVKEAYGENYGPSMPYDAQMLADMFGLTEDMYDVVIAEGPMMSAKVDTFIAVHPTEGNKEAVVEALNNYRKVQIEDTFQYPANLSKIQASEVREMGDYVFFFMLGYTDEMFETEEEQIAEFQKLNQIAVDAIEGVLNK